jgi:hypothetical protein
MLNTKFVWYIKQDKEPIMSEQKQVVGKKGTLKKIAKKLTEMRRKPLSKRVFEIVEESYRKNIEDKKTAKPIHDIEA